jgi:hypothetical protein
VFAPPRASETCRAAGVPAAIDAAGTRVLAAGRHDPGSVTGSPVAPSRQRVSLPYQPDYEQHPAFARHLAWDRRYEPAVDEAVAILDRMLLDLESALTLKTMTLAQAVDRVGQPLKLVLDLLAVSARAAGADLTPYAAPFQRELLRVIVDDLAYFERRNSYQPVINNAAEMGLRNQLAIDGFVRFDLESDELAALRRQVQPYLDVLEQRYRQGARAREELSTNEIDPRTLALVCELFGRRGLNKAVSDVRHETARASGLAVELSPDDTDWWHSRYGDVGLNAPNRAAYFHNDESRDAYKAIVYLDDVGDDQGPFCFVPTSYRAERPRFQWVVARATVTTVEAREIQQTMTDLVPSRGPFSSRVARAFFGMLPPRLRLSSHFGFDLLDDSPAAARLLADEVRMVGRAGHAIAFDGARLVHRGGMVRRGRRAALQVVFEVDKRNGLAMAGAHGVAR